MQMHDASCMSDCSAVRRKAGVFVMCHVMLVDGDSHSGPKAVEVNCAKAQTAQKCKKCIALVSEQPVLR